MSQSVLKLLKCLRCCHVHNGTAGLVFQTDDGETGDLILKGHNGPIIDFDLSQTDEVSCVLNY